MLPIGPAIFAIRLLTRQQGTGPWRPPTGVRSVRRFLWAVGFVAWIVTILVAFVTVAQIVGPASAKQLLVLSASTVTIAFGIAYLFFAFPILRAIARSGRARLVYYLGHFSLVCNRTGETYAGAALLAALAFACT